MVGLPLVLRQAEPLEALHPQRKERPEIRQHSCRDVLHILDRTQKRSDAFDLFECANDRVGAIAKGRRRVHTRDVLRDARPRVDSKHLLDELVLAEIDVDAGNRRQDCFENGSGARVIAREEGFRGPTEMLGHVVRICVADVARRFGERLGPLHDPLRGTCGPPARGGLGGSRDQRVDDRGPYVLIELFQDGAHGCTQLWRAHGVQRSVDLGVFRRHAMSPVAKTSHNALRAYALRRRRRVAVAELAWRAFAARNRATVVHSP